MKKKFLVAALFFAAFVSAAAQENRFGIGVGYTLTGSANKYIGTKSTSFNDDELLNGFYIDFMYEFGITDLFSIQPEAQITSAFGKTQSLLLDEGLVKRQRWNLNIPVFAKFQYEFTSDFKIFGMVGPYFCIGLTCRDTFEDLDLVVNRYGQSSALYSRFNFGASLALGVDLKEHSRFTAGINNGFLNLSKVSYYKSYLWNFYVGYTLLF